MMNNLLNLNAGMVLIVEDRMKNIMQNPLTISVNKQTLIDKLNKFDIQFHRKINQF